MVVKRRALDETASDGFDANMIKEGDLKNHLTAGEEGEEIEDFEAIEKKIDDVDDKDVKKDDEKDMTEAEKIIRLRDAVYEHSSTDSNAMLLDSQVNRAYEILKGYEIFKGLSQK